jgi:serine/threonine protein phosphatase PrpC
MTQVSITSAALSDVGLRREENQDSYLVSDGVFLVADGMGGGVSGQVASATTLEKMNALTTIATRTRTDIDTCLAQAQYAVRDIGERQNAVSGTTLTGLILKDLTTLDSDKNAWYVVNVGDSRTYHLNSLTSGNPEAQRQWDIDSFLQITHDHSERQEAIDSGRLLPDVANRIVPRNIITQAIGSPNGVSPDYFQADVS